jgi:hypothetical protein
LTQTGPPTHFLRLKDFRLRDLDVLTGGWVHIRHTPLLTGANWNAAVDIGPALPGITSNATLPLVSGTYFAKFIDSTGNASLAAASITTNLTDLLEMNVVETVIEHSAFAGTKSGVVYDSDLGGIKLAGGVNWDDYPGNIDTWPMIDSLGGVASVGTYTFANGVDLGAGYKSRVTALIKASGFQTGDTIDQRLENIDRWTSFDGNGLSSQLRAAGWSSEGPPGKVSCRARSRCVCAASNSWCGVGAGRSARLISTARWLRPIVLSSCT